MSLATFCGVPCGPIPSHAAQEPPGSQPAAARPGEAGRPGHAGAELPGQTTASRRETGIIFPQFCETYSLHISKP